MRCSNMCGAQLLREGRNRLTGRQTRRLTHCEQILAHPTKFERLDVHRAMRVC